MEDSDEIVGILKHHPGFHDFIQDKVMSLDYTYKGVALSVEHYPGTGLDINIQAGFDMDNITETQKEAISAFRNIARRYFLEIFRNIDERNS